MKYCHACGTSKGLEDFQNCAARPDGKQIVVDHDHATGLVRGLICKLCNTALGMFEDDIERLQYAITYLQTAFVVSEDVG